MSADEIWKALAEVFEEVLGRPVELREETTAADVAEWDSVAHVMLVLASERRVRGPVRELGDRERCERRRVRLPDRGEAEPLGRRRSSGPSTVGRPEGSPGVSAQRAIAAATASFGVAPIRASGVFVLSVHSLGARTTSTRAPECRAQWAATPSSAALAVR